MSRRGKRNVRMAAGNGDTTSEDLDSTAYTTTANDISSTLYSTTLLSTSLTDSDNDMKESKKVTKEMIHKKQLLHDVELLKIELNQKTLTIENMKVEHTTRVEELEEKLSDILHEKQLIQARLNSQIQLQAEGEKRKLDQMKQEVADILKKQQQLEIDNARLQGSAGNLRRNLNDLKISDEKYLELKSTDVEQISLKDFISIKFYESVHPLEIHCESLRTRLDAMVQELHSKENDVALYRKEAEEERAARLELEFRTQRMSVQLEELKSHVHQEDYKSQNYGAVKDERDTLDREVIDVKKRYTLLETALKSKTEEYNQIQRQVMEVQQSMALMKQDKEYLSKQLAEQTARCTMAEQRADDVTRELSETKRAREELYEKYITTREQYKSEYEVKLRDELEGISGKTSIELERIRTDTRLMYERENKSLHDAHDTAVLDKERALANEKETLARYTELMTEFRQLQVTMDSKLSELTNELKLKQFEVDRIQMLYEETASNLKQANVDSEKYQRKVEVLNKEFYSLKSNLEGKTRLLETRCREQEDKLQTYEKLEQELDDVIMQAAEIGDEIEAEKVMFAYGYGANVPSTAKRRMQQSVHLARRVLQLERANKSLQNNLEKEAKQRDQICQELADTTKLLEEANQPYNYLIESIRARDEQNRLALQKAALLEEDFVNLKKERDELIQSRNQLTTDLERLLNQREELAVIKQVLVKLKSGSYSGSRRGRGVSRTAAAVHGPETHLRISNKVNTDHITAPPTVFTKSDAPTWYKKLQKKHPPRSNSKGR